MSIVVELTDREWAGIQQQRAAEQTILDGIMGRILEKIAVRLALLAGIATALIFLAVYLFHHIYWR